MRSLVFGLLLFGSACGTDGTDAAGSEDGAAARGEVLFAAHCADCHGPAGRGDGPLAAGLPVAAPDLVLLRAMNGGRFPTERVMEQIHGYPGRYHRGMMPEFGPVLDGPVVDWTTPSGATIKTPRALLDIVAWLESIQT